MQYTSLSNQESEKISDIYSKILEKSAKKEIPATPAEKPVVNKQETPSKG